MIEITIVIIFVIIGIFTIFYLLPPDTHVEPITVIAENKTILSKEILFGQVTGSRILKDNTTEIQYKLGTWGFGWEDHRTIQTITNQTFTPNDNIKITESKILAQDCRFYLANGTELNETLLGPPFESKYTFTPKKGDYCGTSYRYEVELVK